MRRFIAIAAIACSLSLFIAAQPALAQHRGGGGHGGGGYHGGSAWHGGGGYRGGSRVNVGVYGGGIYGGYGRGYYGGYYGRGWPYYGYGSYSYPYSYGYQPYYYDNSYAYPDYTYGPSDYNNYAGPVPSSTTVIRQASYSPPEQSDRATVHVMLPDPGAQLYFDDSLTQQTGADRVFTTPGLEAGKSYTYTIRASWMDDRGNKMVQSKDVKVQAGRGTTVDFRNPAGPQPGEK